MKIILIILLIAPSLSWGEIILDCIPTDPDNKVSKFIWALNLDKKNALQLKRAFMHNGTEATIAEMENPIEVFDILGEVIYFYTYHSEHGRVEWTLDTNSLELTNNNFKPNFPEKCTASEKIQLINQSNTMNAVKECEDIGFKKGTDNFMNCVLELSSN